MNEKLLNKKSLTTLLLFLMVCVIHAQQYYGASKEVAISSIKPNGWIKEFLQRQANGLGKSPTVSGYPFNTNMWMEDINIPIGHPGKAWWPYEQTAYYIDGALRCGYLINDTTLVNYAKQNFKYTFNHVDQSGVLGQPKADGWARVVYFRALMAEYEVTKNNEILSKMTDNFLKTPRLFNEGRVLLNIEQILWLYSKTNNKDLLELAMNSFHSNQGESLGGEYGDEKKLTSLPSKLLDRMLSDKVPSGHGVGFVEQVKIPAILYLYTGNKKYLDASLNALHKLEKHHMLVDGCQSSVEHLSGKAINMAHETCDIVDLSWSAGYMLMATNNGHWGDIIERAIFNAGLGALDKTFKAHQYYSAPNQPVAAEETSQFNTDKSWGGMATGRMCYRTGHDTECCTGNIQRMMPVYVSRMWLENSDNFGVTAALYGASEFSFNKNESEINIKQETNYPFDEVISFTFNMTQINKFAFRMRIPAWCNNPEILVNGKRIKKVAVNNGMVQIERKFANNDKIILKLPMEIKLTTWGNKNEGFAVERGPLVFSLPVKKKEIMFPYIGDPKLMTFPNKLMYPKSDWSYALDIKHSSEFKFVETNTGLNTYPWDLKNTPVKIKVVAKKVNNWLIEGTKHAPTFPEKLDLNDEVETLEFVPLGATYLRMTIFPKTK